MKHSVKLLLILTLFIQGCTTNAYTGERQASKTAMGAGVGVLAGAAIGALTGHDKHQRRENALIGAAIGGVAGGGTGLYMDNQESQLRQTLRNSGVSVSRQGSDIILNMPGNITFDTNRSSLKPAFYNTLNSVVLVLKKFDKTAVNVEGHTDNTGSEDYNERLSTERAQSVSQYLAAQGVSHGRLSAYGYGESRPIASNSTDSGRAANRRVEIRLSPL